MALCDVADFMPHDAGELTFVLGGNDCACMNGNKAARQRKSIKGAVADREKEEVVGARFGSADERVAQMIEIFGDFRIRHECWIGTDGIHELRAKPVFFKRAQFGVSARAEVR